MSRVPKFAENSTAARGPGQGRATPPGSRANRAALRPRRPPSVIRGRAPEGLRTGKPAGTTRAPARRKRKGTSKGKRRWADYPKPHSRGPPWGAHVVLG